MCADATIPRLESHRHAALIDRLESGADFVALTRGTPSLLDVFGATGMAVVQPQRTVRVGRTPLEPKVVAIADHVRATCGERGFATNCIDEHLDDSVGGVESGCAVLGVVVDEGGDVLLWFRPESASAWERWCVPAALALRDAARRLALRKLREIQAENERLRAVDASRAALLANVSHELRTPLSGLLGLLDVLAESRLSDEQTSYVRTMKASAGCVLRLLDDLLDMSKLDAGRIDVHYEPLDVVALVRDVLRLFEMSAADAGIDVGLTIDPRTPRWVIGDAHRLRQVLSNLVANAFKFTEKGSVEVRVRVDNAMHPWVALLFEVVDTGIGIHPATQARLFLPFEQGEAPMPRRFGGTGLGLAISKRLVEVMGGNIGVRSTPERGSTFWFTLPFELVTTAAPASVAQSRPTPVDYKARVLVAEDVELNRLLAERALKMRGHSVVLVENGLQAVRAVTNEAFDVVLMDMQMPVMDGPSATRSIRALGGNKGKVPIFALTAGGMEREREVLRASGIDEHFVKPVDWALIHDAIARYCARDRA